MLGIIINSEPNMDVSSVRQMLQDGTQRVNPTAFPRFLWKDERASSTDFFHGFMQGKMVLSVLFFLLGSTLCSHY